MSLLKLIDRIGQGAMKGLQMNGSTQWTKLKAAYEKNMTNKSTNTLHLNGLHARNGTRGNGIGMGHQNKLNKTK